MIPAAIKTDLDGVDPKFAKLTGHLPNLVSGLDPPRVLPQLVAKGVAELNQLPSSADGTLSTCGLAVKFSGQLEIGIRVTGIGEVARSAEELEQDRTPG